MKLVVLMSSLAVLAGCTHRGVVAPPIGAPEPAPPLDERTLQATANEEAHASALDPVSARPRIREVVTLGHSDAEPFYRAPAGLASPGAPMVVAPVTNVTVINQVPTYGYGFGYGFSGRGFGRGYSSYRDVAPTTSWNRGSAPSPGNIAGANWNPLPNASGSSRGGAPTQVGGDWRGVRDYGPRPMR